LCVRPCLLLVASLLLAGEGRAGPITTVSDSSTLPGFFTSPFPAGGSATVSGYAATNYDGEGHLVGPVVGNQVAWRNLTNYNGLPFLINDRFGSGSSQIIVQFSFPIYSVSFDFEIFPNADVADGRGKTTASPGWPDFTFEADGQVVLHAFAVLPGTNGTFSVSPDSLAQGTNEFAPQLIASSGTFSFPGGVTELEFIDWPPVIGVNNLQFNASPQGAETPEPATLVLFGACAVGAGIYAWGRRRSRQPA
jgi:hypothetical protein